MLAMLKKITNINNWLIIILFPFSAIILILILILNPFFKLRFGPITSYRFGHYVKNIELYLSHKKQDPNFFLKTFDFFFLSQKSSNLYFKKMCNRYVTILPFQVLYLAFKIAEKIIFFRKNLLNLRYYDYDRNNHLDIVNCQLKFTQEEINKGDKILEKIGVTKNDKIVCLSTRDDEYMKKNLLSKYNPEHKYKFRNSDVQSYKLASNELTKLGYKVVRVGKDTEKKINFENDKIIDYSKSNIKSDFMDIYLAHRCAFAFGDSSGWSTAAMSFRKYFAFANWVPFNNLHYYSKKFTFIFKYYFDEILNRKLSINEIFIRKIYLLDAKDLKNNKIKIIDNSPEDILNLVLEVESKYDGKFNYDQEYNFVNQKFINFLIENSFLQKDLNNTFALRSTCERNYLLSNFVIN